MMVGSSPLFLFLFLPSFLSFLKNVFMSQSQDFGFPGLFSSFCLLGVQQRFACSFNGFQEGVEANAVILGRGFSSSQGREGNGETIETVFSSCVTYCLVLIDTYCLHSELGELLHCTSGTHTPLTPTSPSLLLRFLH